MTRGTDDSVEQDSAKLNRREMLGSAGVGAAGLGAAVAAGGIMAPSDALAAPHNYRSQNQRFPGIQPRNVQRRRRFPDYNGQWVALPKNPFGGFDTALMYMAEGVQGIDPDSPLFPNGALSNVSGLFEAHTLRGIADMPLAADTGQPLAPIYSGVGGNEIPSRSAEFWNRDILGLSNEAIRDDLWGAMNWHRRMWGLDFDDPAMDGFDPFGPVYQYPGSPDADNEASLFSPRYAGIFNDAGEIEGWARCAPTLLAPDTAYTLVARSGKLNPNYTGGIKVNGRPTKTTAASPEWPGKVRDGGFWGGVVEPMDVLPQIQAVGRGERYFTTPDYPHPALSGSTPPNPNKRASYAPATTTAPNGEGPKWGQWWRRVSPIVGINCDDPALLGQVPSIDATQDIRTAANSDLSVPGSGGSIPARPAARPRWPIGYLPRGSDFFWGNYNLKLGRKEKTITLHYQSEVPTSFRPSDGVPESFPCDLNPNPASAEINYRYDMDAETGIQLFDSRGNISGFPDPSNYELDGQMSLGAPGHYGRVHGTTYPRSKRKDGVVTYHFRNTLLWPPRLNVKVLGDPAQKNFGNINWTIPTKGDLGEANPFALNPFN